MLDVENIFQSLDEYLTGGRTNIGAAEGLEEPVANNDENQREPMVGPFGSDDGLEDARFGPDDDIGEIAYQHARQFNGKDRQCMRASTMNRWNVKQKHPGDTEIKLTEEKMIWMLTCCKALETEEGVTNKARWTK